MVLEYELCKARAFVTRVVMDIGYCDQGDVVSLIQYVSISLRERHEDRQGYFEYQKSTPSLCGRNPQFH